LKIHCLYRDFFLFIKMMNLEKDRWKAYKRLYYNKHSDLLSEVWLRYQGYTMKDIKKLVLLIEKADYEAVENSLKIYDIEENTKEIVLRCKDLLHHQDLCNIYLFIGFSSPEAFILKYKKKYVICIGLDNFRSFHTYPVLLSHWFCNYILSIRNGGASENAQERLIKDGISVYFSKLAYPGYEECDYLFLTEDAYRYLKKHSEEIIEKTVNKGQDNDLFYEDTAHIAYHAGPYIGYTIVMDYINRTGSKRIEQLMDRMSDILQTAVAKD
jgi:AraC-like DNA-binding protein